MSSEISLFDRVTDIDVLIFTKHLSLLLKSGISLADGIEILREQTTRYSFRKLLSKLHQEIANGQPFHISLALFPNVFDSFYVNLVKVGEESGNLEKNLS
jgi:type II secretory pathway component PulF